MVCVPEARVPRSGLGFDVHRFATGRELWLGGVRFDGEDGLMGHSDGDAVCHAVADALLGASALGDVGEHFPESDAAIEGISDPPCCAGSSSCSAGRGSRRLPAT